MKKEKIKLIRTLFNQLIIGKTTETSHLVHITKPYYVSIQENGLELTPLDAELIGKEIQDIKLAKENLMYHTEPGEELTNAYIKAITGIIV